MSADATVRGFRQAIQDLLIPELRSIQVEIAYMKQEIGNLRAETKEEFKTLRAEIREDNTKLSEEIKALRAAREDINGLKEEMRAARAETRDITLRILERLDVSQKYAELSERMARLEQKVNT